MSAAAPRQLREMPYARARHERLSVMRRHLIIAANNITAARHAFNFLASAPL